MSQLLARILLAVFLLPAAGLIYTITFVTAHEARPSKRGAQPRLVFCVACVCS
jgi:hypothetical protein